MKEEVMMEDAVAVELEPRIGPGRELRAAREARSLSQETVAKQLHLDIALVRALEDDDYGKFAAPIFVTGHLRAYARLLSLAPEPLIESYQALGVGAAPALERVAHLSHQPEPVSRAQVPRWLVWAVAVTVVLVVIGVWRSEAGKMLSPIMESRLLPGSGPAGGGDALTSPLPVPDNQSALGSPPIAEQAPAAPAAETPAPIKAAAAATLDLKASKPSWVEVKDNAGNRLFYDLMVPGDAQRLQGTPPFDVLLGYASGVIVQYNGKQVDHGAYARQGMARFRVGEDGTSNN
jgi:cytoskeleton protein RodZ